MFNAPFMTTLNLNKLNLQAEDFEIQINLPASKSISNRALILNALSYSPYSIQNLSDSDDTIVTLKALDSNDTIFDIGAAGTAMRFLTAFLSKTVGEWVITGSSRMKERPIKLLVDALNSLGGKIEYVEKVGFPPLKIYGSALVGGEITLDGGVSSQYISALMMIAPYMQNGLKLNLTGKVISQPYILMTQSLMQDFGVKVKFDGQCIEIEPQTYIPLRFSVESDWSAASYWYEILSIMGKGSIVLKGLSQNSTQGDSKVAELFEQLGVKTIFLEGAVKLVPTESNVSKFEFDFVDQPDLAQTFAVSCCLKNIPFHFYGLQSLKIKETNRIAALIAELSKLGFIIYEPDEGELAWSGENCEIPSDIVISTYHDHRMAMAFAPACLLFPITIENPAVVSKSYPNFWSDLNLIYELN